jgi:hypothetical protein
MMIASILRRADVQRATLGSSAIAPTNMQLGGIVNIQTNNGDIAVTLVCAAATNFCTVERV